MVKKIVGSFLLLTTAFAIIYYLLGGFQSVDFHTQDKTIHIYGHEHQGVYEDPKFRELFAEARQRVLADTSLQLAVVDYLIQADDSSRQFIGVLSPTPLDMPSFTAEKTTYITTNITAHPIVMPAPNKVSALAREYAQQLHLSIGNYTLEIYDEKGGVTVLFPTERHQD